MDHSHQILLSDDEIDNLFEQLQQMEPPPSLVQSILASTTGLFLYPRQLTSPLIGDIKEEFIIYHDIDESS